ncbi:MAG: hypothetical protein KAW92_06260 [Candidatus Cloacimonetes bacterium]|nr:hypothetical protein [Candidatus Cloacimonadota bacterium]
MERKKLSISEYIESIKKDREKMKVIKEKTIKSFSEYEGIDQKFKLNKSGQVDDKLHELVKTTRIRAIRNLKKNFHIRLNYTLQEDILENYNFKIKRILENNLYGYIKIIKDNIYENFHFFSYWFGKNWADLEVSLIGQVIELTETSKKIIELNLHNNINVWFNAYWHSREKKKFGIIANSIIANLPKDIENDSDELKKFKQSDKLFLFWEEVINQYNEKKICKIEPMKIKIRELEKEIKTKKETILFIEEERKKEKIERGEYIPTPFPNLKSWRDLTFKIEYINDKRKEEIDKWNIIATFNGKDKKYTIKKLFEGKRKAIFDTFLTLKGYIPIKDLEVKLKKKYSTIKYHIKIISDKLITEFKLEDKPIIQKNKYVDIKYTIIYEDNYSQYESDYDTQGYKKHTYNDNYKGDNNNDDDNFDLGKFFKKNTE